jgi:hypothetical protein
VVETNPKDSISWAFTANYGMPMGSD